jgi:hypothetical protein
MDERERLVVLVRLDDRRPELVFASKQVVGVDVLALVQALATCSEG